MGGRGILPGHSAEALKCLAEGAAPIVLWTNSGWGYLILSRTRYAGGGGVRTIGRRECDDGANRWCDRGADGCPWFGHRVVILYHRNAAAPKVGAEESENLTVRIDKIEIRNFRCFEELTLSGLHTQLNVFIGENGAGKTALLEAVAAALTTFLDPSPGSASFDGPIPEYATGRAGILRVNDVRRGSTTENSRRVTFEPEYPVSVAVSGLVNGDSAEWFVKREGSGSVELSGARPHYASFMSRKTPDGQYSTLPVVAYYAADRMAGLVSEWDQDPTAHPLPSLTQRELTRFSGYEDALNGHARTAELSRWMEFEARLHFQTEAESKQSMALRRAMISMLPGCEDVWFANKYLEVVARLGAEVTPLSRMSDGQRGLLALAGDIAMRMVRLNPQLEEDVLERTPGIVLIDELDLHLHPRWQRDVAADLRRTFPNVQFLTTTHSPQIIGEVEPECVVPLEGRHVAGHPGQSEGMDTNYILRHIMHTPERPQWAVDRLREIEALIEAEKYEAAASKLGELRESIGDFPESVRLQTRIDRVRLLSGGR
jgi:predicted ATP-binding protein involved in virulence